MRVVDISLKEAGSFLFKDPELCYLSFNDTELKEWMDKGTCHLDEEFIGIEEDDTGEVLALFRYKAFTELSITGHLYIPTQVRGTGISSTYVNVIKEFLKSRTLVKKVVMPIPSPCKHAITAAKSYGSQWEGTLTKCMHWRGHLVDLNFYCLEI